MIGADFGPSAMDATAYAQGVVKNALKSNSNPWLWYGGKAGAFRFAITLMPHTFLASTQHPTKFTCPNNDFRMVIFQNNQA